MNYLINRIRCVSKVVITGLILMCLAASAQAQQEWDIYLLGGQSNAEGRALNSLLPSSLQAAQSDVMLYTSNVTGVGTDNVSISGGSWENLAPGTGGLYGADSSRFGPEITMGRMLADANPTRNIAIVKYGAGGTNLHTQWNPDDTGADNEYDRFLTTLNNAISAVPAGDTYSIKGMAWMQGESDAPAVNSVSPNALAYEANLINLIATVRAEVGVSDLPFVIGQLGHLRNVPRATNSWTTLQSGQARAAALDDNALMVVNSDLPLRDAVHYDAAGQQALGENLARAFLGQIDQLQVNNASFETANFGAPDSDTNDNLDSTLISGWIETNSANQTDQTGTTDVDSTVYSSTSGINVDGNNVLSIVGNVSVEQSLSAMVVEGTTYSLTVAIGDRDAGANQTFAGARIELLSNGLTIADSGDILTADVVNGDFTDISFDYTATAADVGVLGIRLVSLSGGSNSAVDFDNVRISETTGPATGDVVIVQESFGGTGLSLDGTSADSFDAGIATAGGSATWIASAAFLDNGTLSGLSGNSSAHLNLGSYINDAKGTSDGKFELTGTIGNVTGSWVSIGFAASNAPSASGHFLSVGGHSGTAILRASGELDFWQGPSNTGIDGPNEANGVGRTMTIDLDLTTAGGYDGVDNFGTITFSDSIRGVLATSTYTADIDFGSLLLSEANSSSSSFSNLSLTQIAFEDPFLLGDANLDGTVNFLDISPFIVLLSASSFLDEADVNRDGVVNFLDISPFIILLSGG